MLKKIKFLSTVLLTCTLFFSCNKSDDPVPTPLPTFKATMTGAQEVPTNSSIASGTFTSTYDASTRTLVYTVTFTGMTPTAWHLHKGAVGVSGGVEVNLGISFTSPYSGSAVLTTQQDLDLNAHLLYVNIHSAIFPGGEIRGQLTRQ